MIQAALPKPEQAATSIILGVGVIVTRGGRIALGRRLSPRPCWSLPGGKIDPFETVEECARRELYEETGILAGGKTDIMSVANMRAPGLHTITFGVRFSECSGELRVREPDKFSAWEWFPASSLPEDLFLPARIVLDCYLNRPRAYPAASGLCWFSDVDGAAVAGAA